MQTLTTQCSTHPRRRKPFYSPKQGKAAGLSLCSAPTAEPAPCATTYALEDVHGVLCPWTQVWHCNFSPRNMHYASWPQDSAACLSRWRAHALLSTKNTSHPAAPGGAQPCRPTATSGSKYWYRLGRALVQQEDGTSVLYIPKAYAQRLPACTLCFTAPTTQSSNWSCHKPFAAAPTCCHDAMHPCLAANITGPDIAQGVITQIALCKPCSGNHSTQDLSRRGRPS